MRKDPAKLTPLTNKIDFKIFLNVFSQKFENKKKMIWKKQKKFHLNAAWGMRYQCCNKRTGEPGCQSASHRNEHHTDYKYAGFLKFAGDMLNYT